MGNPSNALLLGGLWLVWGYTWVLTKQGLLWMGPLEFALGRTVLATLTLGVILLLSGRPLAPPPRRATRAHGAGVARERPAQTPVAAAAPAEQSSLNALEFDLDSFTLPLQTQPEPDGGQETAPLNLSSSLQTLDEVQGAEALTLQQPAQESDSPAATRNSEDAEARPLSSCSSSPLKLIAAQSSACVLRRRWVAAWRHPER